MLQFQLFRIKVYPSTQGSLFEADRTRPDILRESILSLPSSELRAGLIWHIGNITTLDQTGLYFRVGRTSKSTIEIYNEKEGNFLDQEFETAPYTHAIVDVDLELCALAKKTRLSPTTFGIARQFIKLLSSSTRAHELNASFEIDELKDPEDFISHLARAYSISKFWVRFSRPNAFDANEDFVKPFQRMLSESNGDRGKAELQGSSLSSETLSAVARSAAATGDDAGAFIKPTEEARTVKKQLKGNPVNVSQDDVADEKQKRNLLQSIRDLYRRIRGNTGER